MEFAETIFGPAFEQGKAAVGFLLPSRHSEALTSPDGLRAFAEKHGAHEDVYVGCCPVDRLPKDGKRHNAGDVTGLTAVWADIDVRDATHKAADLPATREEALDKIARAGLPAPTITVDSGHGLHVWWAFKEMLPITNQIERKRAATLVAGFQASIRAAIGTMDSTHDLARVLRIPGTTNLKSDPVPVRILASGVEYNPEELEEFIPDNFSILPSGKQIAIPENPEYPADKITNLLALDEEFSKTWSQKRTKKSFPSGQDSQSEYDMALANMCAQAGFCAEELYATLLKYREMHRAKEKHPGYYEMTIAKALGDKSEEDADETLEEYTYLGTRHNEDEILECLRQKLHAPVTGVTKHLSDPPTFTFHTELGSIHCGDVGGLISQTRFRNLLAATCGIVVPRMKAPQWDIVAQMLLEITVEEDTGSLSIESEAMKEQLRIFLDENKIAENSYEGLRSRKAFWTNGRVGIVGSHFRKALDANSWQISAREMGRVLRQVGAEPKIMGMKKHDGSTTTRSCWILPADFE